MLPTGHDSITSYIPAESNKELGDVVGTDFRHSGAQHVQDVPSHLNYTSPGLPSSSSHTAVLGFGVAPPRPEDHGGGLLSRTDPKSFIANADAVRVVSFQYSGGTAHLTVQLAPEETSQTDADRDRVAERFAECILTRMPGQLEVRLRWPDCELLSRCLEHLTAATALCDLPSLARVLIILQPAHPTGETACDDDPVSCGDVKSLHSVSTLVLEPEIGRMRERAMQVGGLVELRAVPSLDSRAPCKTLHVWQPSLS
ncbi:hypothetical protein OH76DRAFT_1029567 [Lentinus brumalis]|uniref:Uncharacterized protein n=1 Tax=Lentinus brumalis TaxID=2498619 RepID=A0A371CXB6_9APHY|nr:hypothetical protein OH76DRAFT_1029567 [Polyporus brumalis]